MSIYEGGVCHPSFGKIEISRQHGGNEMLFGSSITHQARISIRICEAELLRDLNEDRYHSGKRIIEVFLSPAQFAEAITSLNTTGVPCTIRYANGAFVELPALESNRQKIQDEFNSTMRGVGSSLSSHIAKVQNLLLEKKGKALTVADRDFIISAIREVQNKISDCVPFIHSQFNEAVEQTSHEAKLEIEAFVSMMRTAAATAATHDNTLNETQQEVLRIEESGEQK